MKIGNAPCSWGILEFDSAQPFFTFEQVLDEMAESGYSGTELGPWGFLPIDPARLKEVLEQRNLELPAAFIPLPFSESSLPIAAENETIKIAHLLRSVSGENALVILADDNGKSPLRTRNAGRLQQNDSLTASQWRTFGRQVNRLATKIFEETGLKTAFHHHCGGFVETPYEIGILMDMAIPERVGLCFDTGHYRYGGGDALQGLMYFFERIWHIHFKDVDPGVLKKSIENEWDYFEAVRRGIFCELGSGEINFPGIIKTLQEKEYKSWIIVEQDILNSAANPFENARRNRLYLKKLEY
jgi:inosose dehydratase